MITKPFTTAAIPLSPDRFVMIIVSFPLESEINEITFLIVLL